MILRKKKKEKRKKKITNIKICKKIPIYFLVKEKNRKIIKN